MNSSCIAGGCLDVESPVRVSTVKLQQWAQADREFLRMLCLNKDLDSSSNSPSVASLEKGIVKNNIINVGRQRYLRSYTFSKKESIAERAKKWFKVKRHESEVNSDYQQGVSACSVLDYTFGLLFACMAKVDVA